MGERCHVAIHYGTMLRTRCFLEKHEGDQHEGRGLRDFPYQRVVWSDDDRRTFTSDNPSDYSWEGPYLIPHPQPDHTLIWTDKDFKVVSGPHD